MGAGGLHKKGDLARFERVFVLDLTIFVRRTHDFCEVGKFTDDRNHGCT